MDGRNHKNQRGVWNDLMANKHQEQQPASCSICILSNQHLYFSFSIPCADAFLKNAICFLLFENVRPDSSPNGHLCVLFLSRRPLSHNNIGVTIQHTAQSQRETLSFSRQFYHCLRFFVFIQTVNWEKTIDNWRDKREEDKTKTKQSDRDDDGSRNQGFSMCIRLNVTVA